MKAPVQPLYGINQDVIVVIGALFAITPVRISSVGTVAARLGQHGGIGIGLPRRAPGGPEYGNDGHAPAQQRPIKSHARFLQPETAGIAVNKHAVAVVQAAFEIKNQVQAVHGGVVGRQRAGDGAVGDGIGHVVDEFVNHLMPGHVALRIEARAVRQHDHKYHVVLIHAQRGVLHAVVTRAIERGNGPVTDTGFRQFFCNLGQLLQILGPGRHRRGLQAPEQADQRGQKPHQRARTGVKPPALHGAFAKSGTEVQCTPSLPACAPDMYSLNRYSRRACGQGRGFLPRNPLSLLVSRTE